MKKFSLYLAILASLIFLSSCQSTNQEFTKIAKFKSYCSTETKDKDSFAENSPIVRVSPKPPISAIKNKTSGYVKIEFDVNSEGVPININITESMPGKLFHKASIEALSKWRYKPSAKKCKTIQLDFKFV